MLNSLKGMFRLWMSIVLATLLSGGWLIIAQSSQVEGAAGTPDAIDDSVVMYEDSGPIIINWIANDDMDDNATLDSFDSVSTNGGTVSDNGNGTFSFNPVADFSGGDGFTYTICDDDTPTAECDTASVSVSVVATSVCLTGFYQTLSGEINVLDTTTTPASYVAAAADYGDLNATGYNPNDGLIYGYSSNQQQVVSFDPNTGSFAQVYSHTEDNPFAGDFDSSNNLYYNTSSSTTLYVYNTVSDTRSTITLPTSHGVADFAYVPNDDLFYGIQSGGTNMAIIDIAPTPAVSTMALSGPITSESGGFGATWVTGNTDLYAFNNGSGNIFNINTSTGVSTLVATSSPNGSNDGMSCAAGTDPFDISSILDYGDLPDSYGTLVASSGASAVVNTSYRIGNFNEVDADGQPSVNADSDDIDDIGDDEDGVRVGVDSLENAIIYEGESNTIEVDVPLNAGYVSLWIDQDEDGAFGVGEQFATDVQPSGGVATLTFTPANTTSVPIDTYARVRLAARSGGTATGLYSFGEIEDYQLQLNPSRPTITNDPLSTVSAATDDNYNITGVCTDDGDAVDVAVDDGVTTVYAASTTCLTGTYSVTVDISGLNEGTLSVTSVIDDGINDPVQDVDTVNKDTVSPTITQAAAPDISDSNKAVYPVGGSCTADGDSITITLTDSDSPANIESTATVCSGGAYSATLDASSLIDGSVNVDSTIDDGVNPSVSDDEDVTKDSVLPTITQDPAADISSTNATSYPVSGTCTADGDIITITLTDSDSPASIVSTTTSCSGGTYADTLDASGLVDGNVNVDSTIDDGVNPSVSDDEDVVKDDTVPTIMHNALNPVSQGSSTNYTISGICTNDGDSISVTVSDGSNPDVVDSGVSCSSGTFSANLDISGLNDGNLTVTSDISDTLGNSSSDSDPLSMDTEAPSVNIVSPLPEVDITNIVSFPVEGVCSAIGDIVNIEITDGVNIVTSAVVCQSGGVFASTLNISQLGFGEVSVEATIDDGINPLASDKAQIEIPNDLDADDTSSEEEQAGPNGGDGNDDGIPDYLQDQVTTKVNPIIDAYVTTEVGGDCTEVDSVTFYEEDALGAGDDNYDYPLGLHGFVVDCTSVGGSVDVTYYWDQEYDTNEWQYRKYNFSTEEFVDFSDQVTYSMVTIDGKNVTTVAFTIEDGGVYDADGEANGKIVDPAGPTLGLSNTGSKAILPISIGASILMAVVVLAFYPVHSKQNN